MTRYVCKIDGMMCGMCESHVNDVIRRTLPEVKRVSSSHKKGISEFRLEGSPDEQILRAAIEATGYRLLSMEATPIPEKNGLSLFRRK